MWKKCEVCGKKFHIPYPDIWAYQRNNKYYCTWKCLRTLDKEDEDKKKEGVDSTLSKYVRLSADLKKQAVLIALEGENPLRFLENCGCVNASAQWYNIKVSLKKKDPETYNRLPDIQKKVEIPEKPETEVTDQETQEMTSAEKEEKPVETEKITKPVSYDCFAFQAMQSAKTGIRYEYNREYQFFRLEIDHNQIDLSIQEWKNLLEELPKAARILGVELL